MDPRGYGVPTVPGKYAYGVARVSDYKDGPHSTSDIKHRTLPIDLQLVFVCRDPIHARLMV